MGGRRAVTEAIRAGRATEVLVAPAPKVTQGMRALLEAARTRRGADHGEPARQARRHGRRPSGRGGRIDAADREEGSGVLAEREVATYAFAEDAIVVVLDGITDPQNLGAAARSAEAAGAAMLITRTKRAADVTPSAVRASAGALLHLPHARVANIARAIERLQDAGFWVVGLDGEATASIYDEPAPEGKRGARRRQRGGGDVEAGARAMRHPRSAARCTAGWAR